ncbi:sulfite exporter TauE/SafE family protein [Ideonella sp. A 288]|uniref:sulfite exporter TauE/SafE family protein n=1 Tax=Ideonella sp. A 288 TaxID=1962181 RepID=UPI000B4A6EA2|nr:sulfite exporter TauE/SafE family protein [Ideonella sp. A 288]
MTEPLALLVVIAGAMVAGFVQGLSGFAFGMVAMSIWVWTIDPRTAAVLTIFGSLTGQVVAAVSVRRVWRWPVLLPFLAGGLLGIPVGGWLLPRIDPTLFKALFGLMLVTWCPVMLFSDRVPRISHGGRLADAVVGWIGGVMGGLGGFTGVAPTLWCTLRGMDRDLQRSVVQNFNLATLAVTMAMVVARGGVTRPLLPLLAVMVPAVLLPSLLGARVYTGLSDTAFRRLVLGLLTASGVAMLASSLPSLLAR